MAACAAFAGACQALMAIQGAINGPHFTNQQILAELQGVLQGRRGAVELPAQRARRARDVQRTRGPGIRPPSLQAGGRRVMILACHPGDCHYREGNYRAGGMI